MSSPDEHLVPDLRIARSHERAALYAEVARLKAELDAARADAGRFYRADGSYTVDTPENVVKARIEAAGDAVRLKAELYTLYDAFIDQHEGYCDFLLPSRDYRGWLRNNSVTGSAPDRASARAAIRKAIGFDPREGGDPS